MAGIKKPFRILGLADLHDRIEMLDRLKEIDADLIVFCGDLHNAGSRETALPAAFALANLGPPVLIVPGNMDQRDVVPDLWGEAGLRMLHRSSFCSGDLGFLGMGGMVAEIPGGWETLLATIIKIMRFMRLWPRLIRMYLAARCKVVVVHQPPRGAQDTLYNGESSGSVSLRRFVQEYQPDLLLCGHIHEARGECRIGSTRIVNVGELRQGFAALIEIGEEITANWI